jgi:hypothetical protein
MRFSPPPILFSYDSRRQAYNRPLAEFLVTVVASHHSQRLNESRTRFDGRFVAPQINRLSSGRP